MAKKKLKKVGIDNLINYFLEQIKNFSIDDQKPFKNIGKNKIVSDLQSYASNIIHKKGEVNDKFFKENDSSRGYPAGLHKWKTSRSPRAIRRYCPGWSCLRASP